MHENEQEIKAMSDSFQFQMDQVTEVWKKSKVMMNDTAYRLPTGFDQDLQARVEALQTLYFISVTHRP